MLKIGYTFLLFLISQGVVAQTLKQIKEAKKQEEIIKTSHVIVPPIAVRATFSKDNPNMDVKWKKERGHYEANFTKDGKLMSISYGEEGHKIESELVIPRSQMPKEVMDYIATHYRGSNITETSIIKKSNGMEEYEVEVAGLDVLFTKAGKFIKALKD